MIELLGSIGWGLLAFGAITHVWHQARLRQLLNMHLDHERLPALILTAVECTLVIALPISITLGHSTLRVIAIASAVLALGFVGWIARLLLTDSPLPCACSFSEAPTTVWSLVRALCVTLVGCFALVSPAADGTTSLGSNLTDMAPTLVVGWACAAAIFVLPEALAWPGASRALMARVDAHTQGPT